MTTEFPRFSLGVLNRHHTTLLNDDGRFGGARLRTIVLNLFDQLEIFGNSTKDDVFSIQPRRLGGTNKKL